MPDTDVRAPAAVAPAAGAARERRTLLDYAANLKEAASLRRYYSAGLLARGLTAHMGIELAKPKSGRRGWAVNLVIYADAAPFWVVLPPQKRGEQ